jgi:hypothetical protein
MGRVKIIGFDGHYRLRAIEEADQEHPIQKVYDDWKDLGRFTSVSQETASLLGIYDVGEKCIAAMDKAGIDIQILSHTALGPEELDPSISRRAGQEIQQSRVPGDTVLP